MVANENVTTSEAYTEAEVINTVPQKPVKPKKQPKAESFAERPDEIPEQVWADWLVARKAKRSSPPTPTALQQVRKQAAIAGITLEQALIICIKRGWAGFESKWDWQSSIDEPPKSKMKMAQPPKREASTC